MIFPLLPLHFEIPFPTQHAWQLLQHTSLAQKRNKLGYLETRRELFESYVIHKIIIIIIKIVSQN